MADLSDLERLNKELEEVSEDLDIKEEDHASIVNEINYLQQKLAALRTTRDNALSAKKALSEKKAEVTKKRDAVKIELETRANTISADYINKLDRLSEVFRWNKSILPKQREGAYRIAYNRNMLLGDEMGTGKTISSLAAADLCKVRHLLILVPAKLAGNWNAELKKWAPHRFALNLAQQTGEVKTAQIMMMRELHALKKPTALILNYESWAGNYELINQLIDLRFEGIIMDEAQAFKNKDTHAFKGIKRIVEANNTCVKCKGLLSRINSRCKSCNWDSTEANEADFRAMKSMRKLILPMTGTFLVNSPVDIWPALNIIMPRTFDKERTFLEVFARQNDDGKWIFKEGGAERLTRQLGAKYLKRTMMDMGIDLPEQEETVETISLSGYEQQAQILDDLAKHAAMELEEGKVTNITAIIAQITRQRQAAADPNTIELTIDLDDRGEPIKERLTCDRVAKLDWLEGRIMEDVLMENKRVVVFSQFSSLFPKIKERLSEKGISVVVCDGTTTKSEMEIVRQDFDRNSPDKGKYQVVLANFRVGGAGLNFTDATVTYEFDSPWNPAMRAQAKARTRRIGQTEKTKYIIMELAGTIDAWMRSLVEYKHDMIDGFNMAAEGASVDMTELLKAALVKGVEE